MPKFWIDLSVYNMELLVIGRQPDRRLALIPMDRNRPMGWPDQEFDGFPSFTPAEVAQEIWISDLPLSAALLRRDLWTGEFPDAVFRDGGDLLRDVSVPDVAAALALPGQNFKAAPLPLRKVPAVLRPFLSQSQIRATEDGLRDEEKDFFAERMSALSVLVSAMPATYETDGQGDDAVVHLHYFHRNADWYITEKDSDPDGTGQVQAFGLADLGQGFPEMGYISIQEITRLGAEMDYHFAPRSLLDLKLGKYPEMVQGALVAEVQPDLSSQIPEPLRPFITATEASHWTDVLNEKAATPPNVSLAEVQSCMAAIQEWLLRGGAAQMQVASDAGMNATAILYLHDMASGTDYALTAMQQEPGKPALAYGLSWNASAADVSPMVRPIDLQTLMDGGKLNIILDAPMSLEAVMAHRLANMDPAAVEVHPLDDAFYQQPKPSVAFGTTDPVAQEMLKRIDESPYTLAYLLGKWYWTADEPVSTADTYTWESAQGEFADKIDAILNARIQQNKLAMTEKGWRADALHDDLTRSDFVAARIHLEPDLNAMGYTNGITYQIIQDGKLVQSIRDYLDVSSTQLADNLHSVANEANMDAALRVAAANSGDPYPEDYRNAVFRGDYVRYRDETGTEREGIVLDAAAPGEVTRLRHIYRWPNGPGLDGADHIAPTVLDHLVEHLPNAVPVGRMLDTIDPLTRAYRETMGVDDARNDAIKSVLAAVEYATSPDSPVRFYADHADRTLPDGLLELDITEGTVNSLRKSGGLAAVLASEDLREKHADDLDAIIQARAQSVGAVWMEDGWERDANRFLKDGITVSGQGEASRSDANLVSWGYHLRLPDGRTEYVEDRFGLPADALVSSLKDRIALVQSQIRSAKSASALASADNPSDFEIHSEDLEPEEFLGLQEIATIGDAYQRAVQEIDRDGGWGAVQNNVALRDRQQDALDRIIQERARCVAGMLIDHGWERIGASFHHADVQGAGIMGNGTTSNSGGNGRLIKWGYRLTVDHGERRAEMDIPDDFREGAETFARRLIQNALGMVANADNDLPVELPAYTSRARESLNQSIAAGMSFGDLVGGLRAMDINAVMSSDDINQLFHMPVPADTLLLSDVADRHEDTVPIIRLPENMAIVAWKADLDDYLALQAADAIQAADTETNLPPDVQSALDPVTGMDPDLMAHLRERALIRQGEHPNWSGLSDSVENAQFFIREHAMHHPEQAEKWAAELRGNPFEYGEALGLESDNIRGIATLMEQSVKRARHPVLGDLVRFEPNDPNPSKGAVFSGRVIAAQDTGGGNVRYHLRAEIGPDQGMEGTVYGDNGSFSGIRLADAYGFERNAPKPVESPEQTNDASVSDPIVIYGEPMETAAFLEESFGSDAAFGVSYIDEETGREISADDLPSFEGDMSSRFPDGGITNCTNYARHVQNALPAGSVRVVGFSNEENPNSDVVREEWHPGGHDFAIVDNRYLVDPWAKLLAGVRDRVVYDLQDEADARLVARTYGSPGNWSELPETGGPRNSAWDRRELRLFTIRPSAPIRLSADAGTESTLTPATKRQDAGRTIPFAKKDLARGRLMRSLEGLQSASAFIREHSRSYNSDMVQAVIDGAKSIRRDDILGTRDERLAWLKKNGHDVGQVLLVNALYNLIPASAASMPDMSTRGDNRNSPDAIAFRAMAYMAVVEEIGKRLDALPVEMTQRHWKSWLINPYLDIRVRPGMVESGEGPVETRNMINGNSQIITSSTSAYGKAMAAEIEQHGAEAIRDLLASWPGLTPGALVMGSGLYGKGRTCSQDLLQSVMQELDERPSFEVPAIWERVTGEPSAMSRSSVYPLAEALMGRFASDDDKTEIYWRNVSEGLLSPYQNVSTYRSVILCRVAKQPEIMDYFLEHKLLPVVCNYGYDAAVPAVKEAREAKPKSETISDDESWNDRKKSPDAPYGEIARNMAPGTTDPSPRNGRDITDEEFVRDTGFSVQYGNYVNNKERQALLNMAYDGLYDMAAVLDVPVQALAVRKDGVPLGLALGARGSGRAMAHYESGTDTHVINLTKTKGAGGAMIHEWLHAVDATMGKQVLQSLSPTLHRYASHFGGNALNDFVRFAKLPPESVMDQLEAAGNMVDKTTRMTELWRDRLLGQWVTPKSQESFTARLNEYLNYPHAHGNVKEAMGDKTAADYLPLIRARIENIAQATAEGIATGSSRRALVAFNDAVQFWSDLGRGGWTYDEGSAVNNKNAFLKIDPSLNDEQARVVGTVFTERFFDIARSAFKPVQRYASECHQMSMKSDFYGEAVMLDAGRKTPCWSSPRELLARAGSAVFYDKSREMGIHNDFLDVYSAPESFSGPGFKGNPNPEGAERLALKAHFEQQTLPALRSFLMANLQQDMAPPETDRRKVAGSDISL